jgi:hypothetical protein
MRATPKRKKQELPAASESIAAKAQRMVDRLRQQYSLGVEALHSQDKGRSTAEFAAEQPYSPHTIRKIKAFARQYSPADFNALCRGRRPNGLPLHWGYIPVLLAIEGKHGTGQRRKFQNLAIENGWTVPELRLAVRDQLGVSGHGRTPKLPENVQEGMQGLAESLAFLYRRCQKLMELAKVKGDKSTYVKCRRLSRAIAKARKIVAAVERQ